jgi:hypothetical protein
MTSLLDHAQSEILLRFLSMRAPICTGTSGTTVDERTRRTPVWPRGNLVKAAKEPRSRRRYREWRATAR